MAGHMKSPRVTVDHNYSQLPALPPRNSHNFGLFRIDPHVVFQTGLNRLEKFDFIDEHHSRAVSVTTN